MTRRAIVSVLIFAILCAPIASVLGPKDIAYAQQTTATTTDNLNMRSSASMNGGVILVIPRGAAITVRGNASNGFFPVTYRSTQGWAHSDYISLASRPGSPAQTGTVTESLNLRIGPSTGQRAILVMPAGAQVTITGTSSGGFLAITYGGYSGYAHGDWISRSSSTTPPPAEPAPTQAPNIPSPTGSARITEDLNLRAQPNTSSAVLAVMRADATVTLTGSASGDFLQLKHGTQTGWAHKSWISVTPAPQPTEPPTSTSPSGSARITEDLNLRARANTSSAVLAVMPAGATVTLTGTASGDFLQLKYGTQTGWAHKSWISVTPAPQPTQPPPTQTPTSPSPKGSARITEDLNLRAQPNTTSAVLAVMPAGTNVTLTGSASGDFLQLKYGNRTGWAHKSWISVTATTPTPAPTQPPTPTPTQPPTPAPTPPPAPDPAPPITNVEGTGRIVEDLNLRAQPNTSSAILALMPAGTTVDLTGEVSGLFYQVVFNGRTGWAHKDWIHLTESTVTPQNSARVTEAVNLRGGPATSYKRMLVVPAGALVTLTGQQSNGFHSVSYNGQSGWVFSTYLTLDSSGQNLPVIPPGSVEPQPELYDPISTNQGFHYTNSIIGPTRGTADQAIQYAERVGSVRMDDVELYIREVYRLAPILGFDPSLIVAQSALETGNWKSYWWEERLNPAGLGLNDDPSTHPYSASFPDGTIAARAQLAHMHAEVYGNRVALPSVLQGVDATYQNVFQAGWAGTIVTLEDLSGTWATDPLYGWKISRVASYIFG